MLYCQRIGAKTCCRRGPPPSPEQVGLWYENDQGRRRQHGSTWLARGSLHVRDEEDSMERMPVVILPNLYSVQFQDYKQSMSHLPAVNRRKSQKRKRTPTSRNFRGLDTSIVSTLPTELLVKILEPLVPTGRIFHLTPTTCKRGVGKSVSVHQICSVDDWSPAIDILPLVLTCQHLKDVAYGIFYRRNQFTVELATVDLTSEVQLGYDAQIRGEIPDQGEISNGGWRSFSWSRALTPKTGAPSPIYPLTQQTLSYISDLTICVHLSSRVSTAEERRQLSKQLQEIVNCFGDEKSSLRRLAVSLDIAENRRGMNMSQRLHLQAEPRRLVLRDDMRFYDVKVTPRRAVMYDKLMQPLLQLRGVEEISVRGVLSHEFAARLTGTVTMKFGQEEPAAKKARR